MSLVTVVIEVEAEESVVPVLAAHIRSAAAEMRAEGEALPLERQDPETQRYNILRAARRLHAAVKEPTTLPPSWYREKSEELRFLAVQPALWVDLTTWLTARGLSVGTVPHDGQWIVMPPVYVTTPAAGED